MGAEHVHQVHPSHLDDFLNGRFGYLERHGGQSLLSLFSQKLISGSFSLEFSQYSTPFIAPCDSPSRFTFPELKKEEKVF
jgi:hypothetical protein